VKDTRVKNMSGSNSKRPRSEESTAAQPRPVPVVLDHDGGVDDLVALALLLANPSKVELVGVIVLDADCYVNDAYRVSGKLASTVRRAAAAKRGVVIKPFPILKSTLSDGGHPFPHEWRVDAKKMDDLPSLNVPKWTIGWEQEIPAVPNTDANTPGEEAFAQLFLQSPEPISLCVTGPLTNVAYCLKKHGAAFAEKVREVVIMGGAVDVEGNVFLEGPDVKEPGMLAAEWNIYWDAVSAKAVMESPLLKGKLKLFSLDATNHVPVTSAVCQRFGELNDSLLAQFIGASWAMCTHLELGGYGKGYYAWDVLTAAHVVDSGLVEFESNVPITVEADPTKRSEGQTRRDATSVHCVDVAMKIDPERFYSMTYEAAQFV
jgi:purine nucleosidase